MNSPASAKSSRNDPCPCGSGRKYKACCLGKQANPFSAPLPNFADCLAQAGRAVAAGQFDKVEPLYRLALKSKPNDPEALAGVGQALCWRRKRREGRDFLRRAGRQLERLGAKHRDPGPMLQLSAQLQHWGDMDAALSLARLAHRIAPDSPHALNNLALCLGRVNRFEEAYPHAKKTCEMLPGNASSAIYLAVLDKELGRLDEARLRLESVAASSLEPEQTARAWLELGIILDKQKDYDAAFEAFCRSSAINLALPQAQQVDRQRVFTIIARNKAGFDRELLTRWSVADFNDGLPAPGFLFGFLRSGTTLTEQILAAHPGIIATDENDFILEISQELARLSGIADDSAEALRRITLDEARQLRKLYWQRVAEEYGDEALRKRFVDKLALNSIEVGLIATLFPEAKILFALRDPRDVCLSCFSQPFGLAPGTVNLLSWEGVARQYAAVMGLWLHLRPLISAEYLELRYEDAVGDFEQTYRRVFGLLGVEWRPEVEKFHERARGRYISTPSFSAVTQPLYQTAVARWRRYGNRFEPILPLLGRFIEAFGYAAAED